MNNTNLEDLRKKIQEINAEFSKVLIGKEGVPENDLQRQWHRLLMALDNKLWFEKITAPLSWENEAE